MFEKSHAVKNSHLVIKYLPVRVIDQYREIFIRSQMSMSDERKTSFSDIRMKWTKTEEKVQHSVMQTNENNWKRKHSFPRMPHWYRKEYDLMTTDLSEGTILDSGRETFGRSMNITTHGFPPTGSTDLQRGMCNGSPNAFYQYKKSLDITHMRKRDFDQLSNSSSGSDGMRGSPKSVTEFCDEFSQGKRPRCNVVTAKAQEKWMEGTSFQAISSHNSGQRRSLPSYVYRRSGQDYGEFDQQESRWRSNHDYRNFGLFGNALTSSLRTEKGTSQDVLFVSQTGGGKVRHHPRYNANFGDFVTRLSKRLLGTDQQQHTGQEGVTNCYNFDHDKAVSIVFVRLSVSRQTYVTNFILLLATYNFHLKSEQ